MDNFRFSQSLWESEGGNFRQSVTSHPCSRATHQCRGYKNVCCDLTFCVGARGPIPAYLAVMATILFTELPPQPLVTLCFSPAGLLNKQVSVYLCL